MSTHDGKQCGGPIVDGWALHQIRQRDARIAELEAELERLGARERNAGFTVEYQEALGLLLDALPVCRAHHSCGAYTMKQSDAQSDLGLLCCLVHGPPFGQRLYDNHHPKDVLKAIQKLRPWGKV